MPGSSKPALKVDLATLTPPAPGLHIVATPIGNLGDISLRALAALDGADLVYCEDTRQTRKLMDRFGLKTSLRAYHDHNAAEMRPEILNALAAGKTIALVSDAGTPLVSDPGFKLVQEAIAAGIAVTTEPGASAVMAALVLAGLPTDRFLFLGFLPSKSAARRTELTAVKDVPASLVCFEAPSRLAATLDDLAYCLGDRPAAIARELTKLHEEVRRGTLKALAETVATAPRPKGEIVIVVGPPAEDATPTEDLDTALRTALARASLKTAVAEVTARLGLPRREVYARALALSVKDG